MQKYVNGRRTAEWEKTYRNFPECKKRRKEQQEMLKVEVLAHYGVNNTPNCVWPGCTVDDVDMLSLDHINGGGTQHRKSGGCNGGVIFYRKLRRAGYPDGYQTMCFNHQWKKQLMLLRERS
jgi:hypothetical protein